MALPARVKRLRRAMARRGLDGLLVTNLKNVRYLSGFSGSAGMILVTRGDSFLLTDFRYRVQVAEEVRDMGLVEVRGNPDRFLRRFLRKLGIRVLAFEGSASVSFGTRLRRLAKPVEVKVVEGLVERCRVVKDQEEIALLEGLARTAAKGYASFCRRVRPGITERQAAFQLECELRKAGSGPPPFPIIVASGPNAAKPHAGASERIIGEREAVVVDFGSSGEGYCTDVTRTFSFGEPPEEVVKAYRLVYDSQSSALGAVCPGTAGGQVDDAARRVIDAGGMAAHFGHSTGHGVGLDVHEEPRIAPRDRTILKPGMVITVEPGVYIEGRGGVRIEDTVLVTPDGCRVLTGEIPKPRRFAGPGGDRKALLEDR